MRWVLPLLVFAGTAFAHNETPPRSNPPCTCIRKEPVTYEILEKRKVTLFESQTISNLDSAHNRHFAKCLRENKVASFELELRFSANKVEPKVRASGSDSLVKCVEESTWTFFGPPDKDTTVRYTIGDRYALEKQRLEAAKQRLARRR